MRELSKCSVVKKETLCKGETLGGEIFFLVLFIYNQAIISFLYFHCVFLTNYCDVCLINSIRVKYKIFLSAMEYLPFSSMDDSKGNFEEIIERYLG